jgi:hypothetical protein
MKNIKKIIMILLVGCFAFATVSCDKESKDLTSVTEWPVFEFKGDAIMALTVGTTFVDPGVTAQYASTGQAATVTTIGSVNTSVPGIYRLNYESKDVSGQWTSAYGTTRMIWVTPSIPTVNYAGTYDFAGRQSINGTYPVFTAWNDDRGTRTISQLIPGVNGLYRIDNAWWQASPVVLTFYDNGDGTFTALSGTSGFGPYTSTIVYDPVAEKFNGRISISDNFHVVEFELRK